MALGTYTDLLASVANFLNRKDLTATVPDFVTLAEAQMMRQFVSRESEGLPIPRRLVERADASISTGDEYIAAPSDFVGARTLYLLHPTYGPWEVKYVDYEDLQYKKANHRMLNLFVEAAVGPPRWYTVVGDELQFFPVSDGDYPIELTYIQRLPALAAISGGVNWVFQDHPDAYLYGALSQSAPYLKDDARLTVWGTLFTSAMDGICKSDPAPATRELLRTDLPFSRQHRYGYNINVE
jgi:hypothetical protein